MCQKKFPKVPKSAKKASNSKELSQKCVFWGGFVFWNDFFAFFYDFLGCVTEKTATWTPLTPPPPVNTRTVMFILFYFYSDRKADKISPIPSLALQRYLADCFPSITAKSLQIQYSKHCLASKKSSKINPKKKSPKSAKLIWTPIYLEYCTAHHITKQIQKKW